MKNKKIVSQRIIKYRFIINHIFYSIEFPAIMIEWKAQEATKSYRLKGTQHQICYSI